MVIRSAQTLRCTVHRNSARWSLCLRASTQPRFFPSPTCQQWWIVFPPQLLSFCCGWRLESWPNVLRPGSISCWHLTANNESIWGLHLRPLSLPLLSLVFFPLSVSSTSIWLTVAQHPVSVYQSHGLLTASLAMDWSILLKCWLSKRLLLCGREVMYCGISARAFSALQYKLFEVPKKNRQIQIMWYTNIFSICIFVWLCAVDKWGETFKDGR